jgi:Outer membrane protein beta-barrel domain
MFSKNPITNLENWDKQRISYGFYLGFNNYDYKFEYKTVGKDIQVIGTTGFNVGIIANLRLTEYFDLRFEPGLSFTTRDLYYPDLPLQKDYLREVKSTYINFPLLLKFSALRTGNIRPYLLGGVSTTLNLASNEKVVDDNLQGIFRSTKFNNNFEIGFGLDLYLEYFKFSPSIRGVFSMDDELIRDNDPNSPWTSNITAMKSRGVFVNFTFH